MMDFDVFDCRDSLHSHPVPWRKVGSRAVRPSVSFPPVHSCHAFARITGKECPTLWGEGNEVQLLLTCPWERTFRDGADENQQNNTAPKDGKGDLGEKQLDAWTHNRFFCPFEGVYVTSFPLASSHSRPAGVNARFCYDSAISEHQT
jgi:hypothetical protein